MKSLKTKLGSGILPDIYVEFRHTTLRQSLAKDVSLQPLFPRIPYTRSWGSLRSELKQEVTK